MQFEQVLSKIKVDKQYRIFYSLYNGKFLFATKLEKFYLRNVKECSCNNVFTALAELAVSLQKECMPWAVRLLHMILKQEIQTEPSRILWNL